VRWGEHLFFSEYWLLDQAFSQGSPSQILFLRLLRDIDTLSVAYLGHLSISTVDRARSKESRMYRPEDRGS